MSIDTLGLFLKRSITNMQKLNTKNMLLAKSIKDLQSCEKNANKF